MRPFLQSALAVLQQNARLALAGICVMWFAALCISTIVTPQFFVADESGYLLPVLYGWDASNYRQWTVISQYPSYLYFWVYSILPRDLHTNAKLLNAVCIVASAIPAYALARRILAVPLAAAFAAIVALSPVNSFVFFVMPEPMYFFGFWLTVLIVIGALDKSAIIAAVAGGVAIGLLSLVKPHAVALALGTSVFLLLRVRARPRGVAAAAIMVIAYYVSRVSIGRLLTGQWLWSITGSLYAGAFDDRRFDAGAAIYNIAGHICALLALIAVPFAVTAVAAVRRFVAEAEPKTSPIRVTLDVALLACCLLAVMVAMTVYYSQSVYQIDPVSESIARLHGRYYLFALPLFTLVALGLWQNRSELLDQFPRWTIISLTTVALLASLIVAFVFRVGPVDFPDLVLVNRLFVLPAMLVVPVVCAIFLTKARASQLIAGVTAWGALLAVLTSVGLVAYGGLVRSRDFSNPLDTAFFDASDRDGLQQLVGRPDGIIIGSRSSASDLYRALSYLRCLCAARILADGTDLRESDLPADARWAVILAGVHFVGSSQVTRHGSIKIVRRP